MKIGTATLRGAFAGLVVAFAFGIVSVSGAAAKTVIVGQATFTPANLCFGTFTELVTGVASGNSYTVPKAGVITSWSFFGGATPVSGLKLKVGQSAGSGKYEITGEATAGSQTPNTLNRYPAHIPVKAGDLIGILESGGDCESVTDNGLDTFAFSNGDVAPGTTATFQDSGAGAKFPVSAKVALDCVVPNVKGKTLRAAKRVLTRASCTLGTVVRPKGHRGRVKRQKPAPGRVLAPEAKVKVWLG